MEQTGRDRRDRIRHGMVCYDEPVLGDRRGGLNLYVCSYLRNMWRVLQLLAVDAEPYIFVDSYVCRRYVCIGGVSISRKELSR